jgi:nitrilase
VIGLAAIQMVSGTEVAANLAAAARLIGEAAAQGARLVVLPENFALMARDDAARRQAAEEDGRGPIQDFLAAQARQHGLWLVGGSVLLKSTNAARMRAACLVYDERGVRAARYDKIHLFDVALPGGEQYRESSVLEPGHEPVVVDTPFGRLGLSICYDLRFPELYRQLLARDAVLMVVPSAFTATTGRAHWEVLVRARAIENLAYVIAPNQGGAHDNGRVTHGDSMIVSPWGEVLARRAKDAGVVLAPMDAERQRQVRAQLPSIEHRKLSA